MFVDLNSDLGESYGAYQIGDDSAVMDFISSANMACGFHAGDPLVMAMAVEMAVSKGIAIGAHPGLPDLQGFGRREMKISPEEMKAYIIYQVGALSGFLTAKRARLQHVKLHGALYNMAAQDYDLARAFCEAVRSIDDSLTVLALSGSQMITAAQELGLKTASEVFADRAYTSKGSLVSRTQSGAVIKDQALILNRITEMVKNKRVQSIDGQWIAIEADSICLHGDHPDAVALSNVIKCHLETIGCGIRPFGRKEAL